jgi:hypothetical protein
MLTRRKEGLMPQTSETTAQPIPGLIQLEEGRKTADQTEGHMEQLFKDIDKELARPGAKKEIDHGAFIDLGLDDMEDQTFEEMKKKQDEEFDLTGRMMMMKKQDEKERAKGGQKDLLCEDLEPEETEKDDMTLLNEILNAPSTEGDDFTREWQAVFGNTPLSSSAAYSPDLPEQPQSAPEFMPSNLLDMTSQLAGMNIGQSGPHLGATGAPPGGPATQHTAKPSSTAAAQKPKSKKGQKSDMSAWFSLFADLDPLSNPDAIGKQPDQITDA